MEFHAISCIDSRYYFDKFRALYVGRIAADVVKTNLQPAVPIRQGHHPRLPSLQLLDPSHRLHAIRQRYLKLKQ